MVAMLTYNLRACTGAKRDTRLGHGVSEYAHSRHAAFGITLIGFRSMAICDKSGAGPTLIREDLPPGDSG